MLCIAYTLCISVFFPACTGVLPPAPPTAAGANLLGSYLNELAHQLWACCNACKQSDPQDAGAEGNMGTASKALWQSQGGRWHASALCGLGCHPLYLQNVRAAASPHHAACLSPLLLLMLRVTRPSGVIFFSVCHEANIIGEKEPCVEPSAVAARRTRRRADSRTQRSRLQGVHAFRLLPVHPPSSPELSAPP